MESTRIRGSAVIVVLMIITLLCSASAAQAAAGDLDPTFGTGGKVFTDLGGGLDLASSVAYQADGKVVAAGYSDTAGNFDFALARYNRDGSLDTSFGSGGKILTDVGSQGRDDLALAVAIQPDGEIVAAGVSRAANGYDWDIALVRYNPDGSLDTSFGADGKVRTAFVYGGFANAVALQPDGKIVVAGSSWNGVSLFTLVRYTTNGTLDADFGVGGIASADVGNGEARSVALQPDGKIVASGYSRYNGLDFALARFNSGGSLDSTFGNAGVALTDLGGVSDAFAVAIQPDSKIVATGVNGVDGSSDSDFALARYQADGSLDTSFGSDGKVLTDVGTQSSDEAHAVVIQSDGRILIAGTATGGPYGFAILRYNTDGTLDTTFDGDGKVLPGVFGRIWAAAVPLQPDGRIVVAGDFAGDFALVRLVTTEKGAQEQVADLIALVDSYQLGKLGTSLHDKLVTVQRFLAAGKPRQAEDNLASFIAQVDAQRGKGLTQAQADALKTAALRILDVVET